MNNQESSVVNSSLEALISSFAKANKISKAKLETFAIEAVALATPPKKQRSQGSRENVGRKASPEAIRLRKEIGEYIPQASNKFTSKELAERFKAEMAYVNNTLTLLEKQGLVKRSGYASKDSGTRGRPAVLWEAKAA